MKNEQTKQIKNRYKMLYTICYILYAGKTNRRNEIGVILDKAMKTKVMELIKKSGYIIVVELYYSSSKSNYSECHQCVCSTSRMDRE